MAVADPAVKPSPLSERIDVAVLALEPFVVAPMLALARVVLLAALALPYLGYAVVWVLAAASAAKIVAVRALGEGSAPAVFLQALTDAALKVFLNGTLLWLGCAAVLLCALCLAYAVAVVYDGSGSEFKKAALGAFKRDSTREFYPRAAVLGWVYMPFILLLITGSLMQVMMSSPVDGSMSKGEMIGSMILDVGIVGTNAISCFVLIPALALRTWRNDQLEWKAGLPV